MALSRSLDSRVSAVSLASAGDSSLACCKVMAWWRRSMVGVFGRGEFVVQLIITDARLARSRAIHVSGTRLLLAGLALSLCLVLVAATLYHWAFLQGARAGWPIIGSLVRLVVQAEFAERDRFMRANLDAMARRVGEMQARMVQLESLGERVLGLAGMAPAHIPKAAAGRGGALVGAHDLSIEQLQATLDDLEHLTNQRVDLMTVLESRLFDQHIRKKMIPTPEPVAGRPAGSGFGWGLGPISGQSGVDSRRGFQADTGTPILAAAGGGGGGFGVWVAPGPDQRPVGAALRPGLPGGHRHANPGRRRRCGGGAGISSRLRQHGRDRPWQPGADPLCARITHAGQARRHC